MRFSTTKKPKGDPKGVPSQPVWKTPTEKEKEIQNRVIRSADRGTVESDPTQGWGSKLNNDVLYNSLPRNDNARFVDIGLDRPVASDAYLYFLKQTQGKKGLDEGYLNKYRNVMENAKNIYDEIDRRSTVGEYNEDDDEFYLDGKRLSYTYPSTHASRTSEQWAKRLRGKK